MTSPQPLSDTADTERGGPSVGEAWGFIRPSPLRRPGLAPAAAVSNADILNLLFAIAAPSMSLWFSVAQLNLPG